MHVGHPDLAPRLWTVPGDGIDNDGNGKVDDVHGWNTNGNNAVLTDNTGHGTHVAGTIGAAANDGLGVTGVAWDTAVSVDLAAPGTSILAAQARITLPDETFEDGVIDDTWIPSGPWTIGQDQVGTYAGITGRPGTLTLTEPLDVGARSACRMRLEAFRRQRHRHRPGRHDLGLVRDSARRGGPRLQGRHLDGRAARGRRRRGAHLQASVGDARRAPRRAARPRRPAALARRQDGHRPAPEPLQRAARADGARRDDRLGDRDR
jgi:hypothetical protein